MLVAPRKSSVLTLNLLEACRVDRSTKFSHDPMVYVGVAFVARLVDQVEVTVDEHACPGGGATLVNSARKTSFLSSSEGP